MIPCWFLLSVTLRLLGLLVRLKLRSPFFHQPELNLFSLGGCEHYSTLAVENSSAFFRSFRISDLRALARSSAQERSGSTLESGDLGTLCENTGVCPLPDLRHDQLFLLHNFCAI